MNDSSKSKILIALPATGDDEADAVREVLRSGWLTQGPKVAAFEQAFAKRHAVKHALATTSCTTALHLALLALGVGPGDEVIVPSFTWIATANAAIYCGAKPVLVDVERGTFNIDPDAVAKALTPRTKAVIAVHLFGLCADMHRLRKVLPTSVSVVEDAACAAGAAYQGHSAGSLGDVACFSFHPRKSITTGEGGMLTTADDRLAARAGKLRNHGASVPEELRHAAPRSFILPDFPDVGFNYRMTDLQAAVGLVQLGKLDHFVDERSRWADFYRRELSGLKWLTLPSEPTTGRHAWQSFVTYVDPDAAPLPRDMIMQVLEDQGIATRPGTHAIHKLSYYRQRFGFRSEDLPNAHACDLNTMALPLHNRMSEDDFSRVVGALWALK